MGVLALLTTAMAVYSTTVTAAQPRALIYRGPASCKGCSEAVAGLLQSSSHNFTITYAGPSESVAVNAESLSKAEVYAQPGGPGTSQYSRDTEPFSCVLSIHGKSL
jgi:hypothetical protein